MPGQPNTQGLGVRAERRDRLRRAAPRDYQAQSHLPLTDSSATRHRESEARRTIASATHSRRTALVSTAKGRIQFRIAEWREGCLASPTSGTRLLPGGGFRESAGRPRGTTRHSPTPLRTDSSGTRAQVVTPRQRAGGELTSEAIGRNACGGGLDTAVLTFRQGPHPSASPTGVRDAWPAQHSGTRLRAERRDGLRRAAPRDYQAQSHLARLYRAGSELRNTH